MSLKAEKKSEVYTIASIKGGVNINDPAISLPNEQCAGALNAIILDQGVNRWPGCENLTAKGACTDYLRSLDHHSTVDGTNYLYTTFGGKLYLVNKTTGAVTELYNMTTQGEAYGCSAFGSYFVANGASVVKAEGGTAYQVGITAPTGVTAAAATSGGSLEDGVYKLYASYARRVGGLNVLYSKGQLIANVTITGGGGSGKITISNFANSSDAQVGNKVIWMTEPDDSTWYLWDSTGDNTTTTWDITSATPENNAITYSAYAANNDLPGAFSFLFYFDRRLWGIIENVVYYSLKGYSKYDLERFPATNKITYPYQANCLFSCGGHLCVNTVENGVIIQPEGSVTARYEHIEQETSFIYPNTIDNWGADKIGITRNRVGVFKADSLKFDPFDYGYNIRPVLERVWYDDELNHRPCGIVHRRGNRIEYLLSLMDSDVNETNNNRTWVLNLSRTAYLDIDRYRTPWEPLGRGFNYVCQDTGNVLYMGQSFDGSSTIYKELSTHTTEKGIYGDSGTYLDDATDMSFYVLSKTFIKNMFTKVIIENIRAMFEISSTGSLLVSILDDPAKDLSQETDASAYGASNWDEMDWDDDNWSSEGLRQYEFKGDMGVFGYSWNLKFSQTADDISLNIAQFDVLVTKETGRGI